MRYNHLDGSVDYFVLGCARVGEESRSRGLWKVGCSPAESKRDRLYAKHSCNVRP